MREKQCRTCRFALMLIDVVNVVHCGSEKHAEWMDEQAGGSYNVEELKAQGFLDLCSLEAIAEETYCCPHWEPKKKRILLVPARDENASAPYPGDIQPGEYDLSELVRLLRKHKDNSEAIQFIADMLEE